MKKQIWILVAFGLVATHQSVTAAAGQTPPQQQGGAQQGGAQQGGAQQGKAQQGGAQQGKAQQGKAQQGKAQQGKQGGNQHHKSGTSPLNNNYSKGGPLNLPVIKAPPGGVNVPNFGGRTNPNNKGSVRHFWDPNIDPKTARIFLRSGRIIVLSGGSGKGKQQGKAQQGTQGTAQQGKAQQQQGGPPTQQTQQVAQQGGQPQQSSTVGIPPR